jgi:hypothetical protein
MARPKLTDEDQFATDFDLKVIGHRLSASQITMKPTFTFGTARGFVGHHILPHPFEWATSLGNF